MQARSPRGFSADSAFRGQGLSLGAAQKQHRRSVVRVVRVVPGAGPAMPAGRKARRPGRVATARPRPDRRSQRNAPHPKFAAEDPSAPRCAAPNCEMMFMEPARSAKENPILGA